MRLIFGGGRVFDGSGAPLRPSDVAVRGERIEAVAPRGSIAPEADDRVIDCSGRVLMPGLTDGHAHLTFPSAVGDIDPTFNPPIDISFFFRPHPPEELYANAASHARILLDAGFTSAYSAGSLLPGDTEVRIRDAIEAGDIPGPRLRAASVERDNHAAGEGGEKAEAAEDPDGVAAFVEEMAALGFDNVKLLLSNDDVFFPGGSQVTQYSESEVAAAAGASRRCGVALNAHAQSAAAVKLAARNGFRAVYHLSYIDDEGMDLLEEHRDDLFVGPAVGIIWANVHEGSEFGIGPAEAERMGSVASLAAMERIYPELRRRGVRVVIGGDYGFPNNPIGRQARDLGLFVELFGYSPTEALRAATVHGAELMGRGDELGRLEPGFLADLLVVDGDPTDDVRILENSERLLAIVQGGRLHKLDDALVAEPISH